MQQKIAGLIGRFVSKNWLLLTFIIVINLIGAFFRFRGQFDLFEFPFRANVWGTFADWIGALASILTLIAAFYALNTWKFEKKYDLEIEAKANSWRALNLIHKFTTVPIHEVFLVGDSKERFENLVSISPDLASCYLEEFLIEQIRIEHLETYIELNTLAEKVKFAFIGSKRISEENIYNFYKSFSSIYTTVSVNAFDLREMKVAKHNKKHIIVSKMEILDRFLHKGGRELVADELAKLQAKLII